MRLKKQLKKLKNTTLGPTGQTVSFYALIFMIIPHTMKKAKNHLLFTPGLASDSVHDSCKKALSRVLPCIIGPHGHGFMALKGIQEPAILATHMIQEANRTGKQLQLVSFDIKKAFDRVGHMIISQALMAFGIPEIIVQAIQSFTLIGFTKVGVNGRQGLLITIKTGSGTKGSALKHYIFSWKPQNLCEQSSLNGSELVNPAREAGTLLNSTHSSCIIHHSNLSPWSPNLTSFNPL
jgi:hypothetical protein